MHKKSILFPLCIYIALSFSYVCASESEASEWSEVSEGQQTFKFSNKKQEMTVVEALHRASGNHELKGLRLLFNMQKMFDLFGAGAATQEDINSFFEGHTPLMRAVYKAEKRIKETKTTKNNVIDVVTFLLTQGARVDVCDQKQRNALMYAAQSGCRPSIFQLLVDAAENNFDAQDLNGNTAAHLAIRSPQLLRILQKAGANVALRNKRQLSPLEMVATCFIKDGDKYRKTYKRSVQILSKR